MSLTLFILAALALGSFSNNVISFFTGLSPFDVKRSRCRCGERELKARELIPVLSFLFQKGKCRSCRKEIPYRYIIIEIAAFFLGLASFYVYGLTGNMALHYAFFMALLITGAVDLKKLIIPNLLVMLILMLAAVKLAVYGGSFTVNFVSAVSLFAAFMLVNYLGNRLKGKSLIGPGDIKLIAAMTLFVDFPASLFALWLSAFIAIPGYYVLSRMNEDFKLRALVPFGFFLAMGYTLTVLFSGSIYEYLTWYFLSGNLF